MLNCSEFESLLDNALFDPDKGVITQNISSNDKFNPDGSKLLRQSQLILQLSNPSSPVPVNPMNFIQVLKFHSNPELELKHPRNHNIFQASDLLNLEQYRSFTGWFNKHIKNYLENRHAWSQKIHPERLLYIYGNRGMGRLSTILSLCKTSKINLLFVSSCFRGADFLFNVITEAKNHTPCIIYFDDADYIFHPESIQSVFSAMNLQLSKHTDQVWTIIAANTPPLQIGDTAQCFIERYGSIIDVPTFFSEEQAQRVILHTMRVITSRRDYPCTFEDLRDPYHEFGTLIKKLASYTMYCTFDELYQFLIPIFRKKNFLTNGSGLPAYMDFLNAVTCLPNIDMVSTLKTISSRKTHDDFNFHDNMVHEHTLLFGRYDTNETDETFVVQQQQQGSQESQDSHQSREQQRIKERNERYELQERERINNMLSRPVVFSSLSLPDVPPQTGFTSDDVSYLTSPSRSSFTQNISGVQEPSPPPPSSQKLPSLPLPFIISSSSPPPLKSNSIIEPFPSPTQTSSPIREKRHSPSSLSSNNKNNDASPSSFITNFLQRKKVRTQ